MPAQTNSGAQVGLPSRRVWPLVGVAQSTLNYWVQLGLITPSIRKPNGRRAEQIWSIDDVVAARVVKELRRHGVPIKSIRYVVRTLRAKGETLSGKRLEFTGGRDVLVVDDNGDRTSVLRPGQGVLLLLELPLGEWHSSYAAEAELIDLSEVRRRDSALSAARRQRSRAS